MLIDPIAAKTALLRTFPKRTILVVGDVMLDQYVWGGCHRISPEAPVPVVNVQRRTSSLGGAANVATNLASLGVRTELAGYIGADPEGAQVRALCKANRIGSEAIVELKSTCTSSKTRIIADMHQLVRVDDEVTSPKSEAESDALLQAVKLRLKAEPVSGVILSDYAKGCCTPYFCRALIGLCGTLGIPVYVDPKGSNYEKYRGATAITPNRHELAQIAGAMGWPANDHIATARNLQEFLGLDFVALTLGAGGIAIVEADSVNELPTVAKEVFDVSGAGDTVVATMVAGLSSGLTLLDSVALANLAAGDVVARAGTTPITTDALLVAIQSHSHLVGLRKLYEVEDLVAVIAAWRSRGQKIAFTNGCYDLLHAGHVALLQQAAALGDRLIVGINSDASVTRLKGPSRPLMPQDQRASVLSALECTDAIVVFEEDTPLKLIEAIRPDVLIKGGDYANVTIVGADLVESYGGEVKLIPLVMGVSTSHLAAAIEKL